MPVLNIPTAASIPGDVLSVPIESVVIGIMSEDNETIGNTNSL